MPVIARLEDGRELQFPEGTDPAIVAATVKKLMQPEQPPAAVQAGSMLRDIPRQLGLTARYGIEGLGQAAGLVSEPIRAVTDRVFGGVGKSKSAGAAAASLADMLGLPSPASADERVIGDASRLLASAGGLGGVGRAVSEAPGIIGQLGQMFAQQPTMQALSAAGSGLAGGSVREAGGGAPEQMLASLAGGVAGGLAARPAEGLMRRLDPALAPIPRAAPAATQQVEQTIAMKLQGSGVDWNSLPERAKQSLRAQAEDAMRTGGELDSKALARMADYARVGATPTRGAITQDPVQITQEMNLAKTGANSTDLSLQRLPMLQSTNTQRLLSQLDDLGAAGAPDKFAAGQRVLGALDGVVQRNKSEIGALYDKARESSGRSVRLDASAFTSQANKALDEALLGGKVPPSVADQLNRIAKGEVPFDVNYSEQLKTAIGQLQRASSDGAERMALGVVRKALDDTPIHPIYASDMPSGVEAGQTAIDAFNAARRANREWMQQVENTPALEAAMKGIEPDQFFDRFILSRSATAKDVSALQSAVQNSPEARDAMRGAIAAHLKSVATGGADDINRFAPSSFNTALQNIGDRKLAVFFSPEEIEMLKSVGRVAQYASAQPAGSAVNNSNTAAMMIGRIVQMLDSFSGKLPLGADQMVQGVIRGSQTSSALDAGKGLLLPAPRQPLGLLQGMGPATVYGGLLATQPAD